MPILQNANLTKCQFYKMLILQNANFTKCQSYKMPTLQNAKWARLQDNKIVHEMLARGIHIVVELSPRHHKVEGLSPAASAGTKRAKRGKKLK